MRPPLLNPLFADVSSLPSVGPALAKCLARLKITRVLDLAFHLPVSRVERASLPSIDPAYEGRAVTLHVRVEDHAPGQGRAPFRVRVRDGLGLPLTLAFFGDAGRYAARQLPVGARRVVSGRLERFGDSLQMVHPDYIVAEHEAETIPDAEPVYGLTEGLANKRMGALAAAAMSKVPQLPEWGPAANRGWPPFAEALRAAHALDPFARDRLAFDELFATQLALLLARGSARARPAQPLAGTGALTAKVLKTLPYQPTGAQLRALAEIAGDVAKPKPMLRLLQGDVGAGKTLVALLAMLTAVEAGAQAAMLAPTEILARQHAAGLAKLLDGLPVRLELLTGRDTKAERAAKLAALASGAAHIAVGTHALFQEPVAFQNLALAVVDEQHRFGVEERKALADKARLAPHLLAMTATPIPRTLALTAYGEMDVSVLDECPPGRQPIDTRMVRASRYDELVGSLSRHLAGGGQAYWVCPLVEGREAEDDAAAVTRAAELRSRFGVERVELVHGRMKGPEKDLAMARFARGEARLLVATTVIEVGVDVPAANLIVIEAAEKFGLAQLHQLRGRVGRGGGQSWCLLLHTDELSETAKARLSLMRATNDGFRIAEEDLALRGSGEVLGTRQAGEPVWRLATTEQVGRWLGEARAEAEALVRDDPALASPQGQAARVALYLFERDWAVRLLRSG
jgi:ATP-dependent DNA helicase RecG